MNEMAWFAGLFEGEGMVTISSGGRRGYTVLVVVVEMTDSEVPRWFHERWGGSLRSVPSTTRRARPSTCWRASSRAAAGFLYEIRPFIRTQRVGEKVDLALEYHETRQQGARDPDYRERRWGFKHRMAQLNHRGLEAVA